MEVPSAQCDHTDSFLKKSYESADHISRAENTVCQLIFAASNSLESAKVDPAVPCFFADSLTGYEARELGSLLATLLTARWQVWLAQGSLPEDCKTLRDLPTVPGHLFGLDVSGVLKRLMKMSATIQQLTQEQRTLIGVTCLCNHVFAMTDFRASRDFRVLVILMMHHPHSSPAPAVLQRGPYQRLPTTSKG